MRCEICRYFEIPSKNLTAHFGRCMRYAPHPRPYTVGLMPPTDTWTWPIMRDTKFCGEFQPKPEENP